MEVLSRILDGRLQPDMFESQTLWELAVCFLRLKIRSVIDKETADQFFL